MTDKNFKVVLLGASNVGKTCLILRYMKGQFLSPKTTVGAGFFSKSVTTPLGTANLEIWDTAGQERYGSLIPMVYRDANAVLVTYDISDESTYRVSENWLDEVKATVSDDVFIMLIGNKCDLPAEDREVSTDTARVFASHLGIKHMETSAKTGHRVQEIFSVTASGLMGGKQEERPKSISDPSVSGDSGDGCGC
ncbi:Small GTPase like protein [Aduncisulcus paluster]|uniref:Small GTPase like protein n=1 Tax=Aduncisulcus paluster TaxID=2918883 RepID=A0ABQ5KWC2_9EUKA|nr:Small GTPase like protein [Aduncisulcus paluster]